MKKNYSKGYAFACFMLLSLSCQKDFDQLEYFRNPLQGGCQVAEYHIPIFDSFFPPHFIFLFKKTFDPYGRMVKSIECNFWDANTPDRVNTPEFRHNLLIVQKAMKVYLINQEPLKTAIPDTVARVTLNKDGRAISCTATGALNPDEPGQPPIIEHFIYRYDHIVAVKSEYLDESGSAFMSFTDSIYYDHHGNISSFKDNTYQYDYARKAKQQFYCDDFMGSDEPFYLLQYLGFFPEVNSPENIRTHVETEELKGDLTNHQFDGNNRLIGYDFNEPITISWNCNR